jgi:stage V sporulation protein B
MGILFFFADEIGGALYKTADTRSFIRLLSLLVPIIYFDTIVDGLLNGLNLQVSVVRINIYDSLVTTALTFLLLPNFGINGYLMCIFISEFFNTY